MKKIFLLGVFTLFLISVNSFAQSTESNSNNKEQKSIEEKLAKYQGTYQIELINTRQHPLIPYNLDEIIEKNRDKTQTKYVSLGTNVRLKILSESEVNKSNFDKNKLEQIVVVSK